MRLAHIEMSFVMCDAASGRARSRADHANGLPLLTGNRQTHFVGSG
jgi:hypothetical protein